MEYVKAMRPVMGAFSSLLCLAALRLQAPTFAQSNVIQTALLLIAVFCGTSATMVWNDFVDREHDLKKDKTHAYRNQGAYIALSRRLWIVCASCCVWASKPEVFGWLQIGIFCLCIVGIYYSYTYQTPGLPALAVGFASASPSLFALFVPHPRSIALGLALFGGVMLTICTREILKDLEDEEVDRGYKATLPVLLGRHTSKQLAAHILIYGALLLSPLCFNSILVLIPTGMIVSGLVTFWSKKPESTGKLSIDLCTVGILVALLFVPMGS